MATQYLSRKALLKTSKSLAILERRKASVFEAFIRGSTIAGIAERFGVAYNSAHAFINRHAEELRLLRADLEKQVTDYAIAQQVERIAALDDRWQRQRSLIEIRSKDTRFKEPGYETGLLVHQLKAVGDEIVDTYQVDTGLLAEMRNTERAAAEQLGQLPRPDVHINQNVVLIREVNLGGESVDLG